MKRRNLFWQLYPYLFAIIIISLVLITVYASREMRNIHISEITRTLENRASLLEVQFRELINARDTINIDSLCKEDGRLTGTRITVIDGYGKILGDSEKNPNLMENHRTRPEIAEAFKGKTGFATRFSNTLQTNMKYVALPAYINGNIEGVIRVSLPASDIEGTLNIFYKNVTIGGIIIVLLAALVSFYVFKRFTKPLVELQKGAENFANGLFDYKIRPSNTKEISSLTESMNRMAEELNSRISTIVDQRNEREAILTSMTEGILALDSKQNIVILNKAASLFFNLNIDDVLGKSLYEVLRISDLHSLVNETLANDTIVEKELRLSGENDKYFQVHGSPLTDVSNNRIGMVFVFNDITGLKKLENIRRDFVANVSHELKTPITAILGSAETLLETGLESSADSRRFLGMIVRHSERLNSLVDDLLTLARVESEIDEGQIEFSRHKLADVIISSIALCKARGEANNIQIVHECDESVEINMNIRQMEQALTNLIDNAIKYSKSDDSVLIKAVKTNSELTISVEDHGCGIENKHLLRLFERFYRVDSGRSREIGGTGLGLAIVKHVSLAHGGRVSVESTPGEGSKFSIILTV